MFTLHSLIQSLVTRGFCSSGIWCYVIG